jgi:hypothetical protein
MQTSFHWNHIRPRSESHVSVTTGSASDVNHRQKRDAPMASRTLREGLVTIESEPRLAVFQLNTRASLVTRRGALLATDARKAERNASSETARRMFSAVRRASPSSASVPSISINAIKQSSRTAGSARRRPASSAAHASVTAERAPSRCAARARVTRPSASYLGRCRDRLCSMTDVAA